MKNILIRSALAFLYPRRCPFCNQVIGNLSSCSNCENELKNLWLKVPRLPDSEHHFSQLSGAAAILRYDSIARDAILRMKNAGKAYYAELFAAEIARRIFGCTLKQKNGIIIVTQNQPFKMYDMVIPVPSFSHNDRGYSVPELLARPLADYLEIPCDPAVLMKTRQGEKQEGKSAQERLDNVKGLYQPHFPDRLEGKRILLVDDVITTGATVSECASVLMSAGANDVFAVSVAETQFKG